jgi:hypothetical protein
MESISLTAGESENFVATLPLFLAAAATCERRIFDVGEAGRFFSSALVERIQAAARMATTCI